MKSFIPVTPESDFSLMNIPFGVFRAGDYYAVCTRVGDTVIDLSICHNIDVFNGIELPSGIFNEKTLNPFISLGKAVTSAVRSRLQEALSVGGYLDADIFKSSALMIPAAEAEMVLPLNIGDYTDFYSSREHATNVGKMFRDPANALLPNWLHLPVGYHGRASSITVSGTPVVRPSGQTMPEGANTPHFGKTKQLDFELEMAFVIGKENPLGRPIPIEEAEDYIFGLMLFNDWSARDIQKWEYVPLGPFLAKNFASTVSPWIVTLEALEPFRVKGPEQKPEVLPYLSIDGKRNYDIHLSVEILSKSGSRKAVCHSNFRYMYWNMCQQLAHHTVNGCNVRIGDLMASGTISGETEDSFGSMLELCWKGTKPIQMPDGTQRTFIEDGDTVIMRGWNDTAHGRIGFGECSATVLP
jgi:fumarylacetoacetase